MPRHLFLLATTLALVSGPSCTQLGVAAQAGYATMAIDGDVALAATSGGGAASLSQDVETAFGLGDPQGSAYGRLQFDFGVPVLTVSAFQLLEEGQGTLVAQFGNLPAGTDVLTDLSFFDAKASLAFGFDLGPVRLAPGLAIDYIDLDMQVQDTFGILTEDIEVMAPIPLLYLGAELDLGIAAVAGEIGVLDVPEIDDVEGTFWDAELQAELELSPAAQLFVGYRFLSMDARGTVDGQDFAADLEVSGWMIGGTLRF